MHMLKSPRVNERPCRIAFAQTITRMRAQTQTRIVYRIAPPFLAKRIGTQQQIVHHHQD